MESEPEIDLVSYDYIMASVLKTEGRDFDYENLLRVSLERKLSPTKEQLCLIVDMKLDEPYMDNLSARKRISVLNSVAQPERTICKVTKQAPYFDELHGFYEREIDGFVAQQVASNRNMPVDMIRMIAESTVYGTYRPNDTHAFMDRLTENYLSRRQSSTDYSIGGKYRQMMDMSRL